MRRILLSLMVVLAYAGLARAGVYNLDPPRSIFQADFVEASRQNVVSVLMHLGELRAIHDRLGAGKEPPPNSLRAGYLRQATGLQAKERMGVLSARERIDLGACLLRLGRLSQAREVLEEADRVIPADAPGHFLILLNLASAYGEEDPELLPRAIANQTRALKSWPEVLAGWTTAESEWYRRAETFLLRLMHLRQAEIRTTGGRPGPYNTVDALFPGVRFVGRGGSYQAGAIDFDMRNQLPRDAESLVIQLMLWRPFDDRLYWLYGELLNARGELDSAYRILNELVDSRRQGAAELRAHRRVLLEAQEPYKQVQEFIQQPTAWEQLLWVMAPRGQLSTPGIGYAANETAWAAALQLAQQPAPMPSPPPAAPVSPSNTLPDWRPLIVSFLTGIVVAVLAALQWRQWRRPRRNAVALRPPAADSYSHRGEIVSPSSSYSRPADG